MAMTHGAEDHAAALMLNLLIIFFLSFMVYSGYVQPYSMRDGLEVKLLEDKYDL